jgi:tetratricopeptide (TPR) repeat protein
MRSLALAVLLLWTSQARAGDLAVAKEHYARGTTLYDLQRFAEAAREYEAAFEQRDEPALLFNIGQAYRFAGETQKALGAFRAYLRRLPDADNRDQVAAKIAELQRQLDLHKPPVRETPEPLPAQSEPKVDAQPVVVTAPPPAPHPTERLGRKKRIAGLALGGVGLAGLAVGIAFEVLASNANHDLSHPAPNTRFTQSMEDRIHTDQAVEAACFAVGGAALVTGAVLYIAGARQDKPARISFIPSLSPGAVAGRLQLRF